MKDPFHSPFRKIARANHHLSDLQKALRAFSDSNPYTRVKEPHENGISDIHKIVLAEPFPDEIEEIVADAANCLRAALDQSGYAIARASGLKRPRQAYFPFAPGAAELENVIKGRCSDLPPKIIDVARSLKPYKGGNGHLWAVNDIANADKHRSLTTTAPMMETMVVAEIQAHGHVPMPPRWDSVNNEMIFAIASRNHPFKANFGVQFYVAFHEVETIRGHPVDRAMQKMAADVENAVKALQAEAGNLGYI